MSNAPTPTVSQRPSSPWANVALGFFLAVGGTVAYLFGQRDDTTAVIGVGAIVAAVGVLVTIYGVVTAGVRDGIALADIDRETGQSNG